MLETTSNTTTQSDSNLSNSSEEVMDFTLTEHYSERVKHHWNMLKYYLDEQRNLK